MTRFQYQAREASGGSVQGTLEAVDRPSALKLLDERRLFPLQLEAITAEVVPAPAVVSAPSTPTGRGRIRRKDITAFTRELATLLAATISIPAALEGLAAEEQNQALRGVLVDLLTRVRTGSSLSAAMETHCHHFPKLYTSMVRVGEESGALDKVLGDLAELLEHDDEVRGEALSAVAYPAFVLAMGVITAFVLLVFVLPRLFSMLVGMTAVLPLPTRVLLAASSFFESHWLWLLGVGILGGFGLRAYIRSPRGSLHLDALKLEIPLVGAIFRSGAIGRFARMLGILLRSGVSLLPALEIVRHTVGNRFVARRLEEVSAEARGGDSLAVPLRKTGLFPPTVVQMVAVGEETGRLDEMLLRVAAIEERQMRGRARTLISLLAPALILVVGVFVGFVVIALLLPIFKMSQVLQ